MMDLCDREFFIHGKCNVSTPLFICPSFPHDVREVLQAVYFLEHEEKDTFFIFGLM